MSGLGGVLAGRRPAGVHRWPGGLDAADLAGSAHAAGWSLVEVDGAGVAGAGGVGGLLDLLAGALDLPEHFGRNLDALHDCLAERERPLLVVARDWGPALDAEPARGAVLLDVLGGRTPGEAPLEVVLTGEPGEVGRGVPELD